MFHINVIENKETSCFYESKLKIFIGIKYEITDSKVWSVYILIDSIKNRVYKNKFECAKVQLNFFSLQ